MKEGLRVPWRPWLGCQLESSDLSFCWFYFELRIYTCLLLKCSSLAGSHDLHSYKCHTFQCTYRPFVWFPVTQKGSDSKLINSQAPTWESLHLQLSDQTCMLENPWGYISLWAVCIFCRWSALFAFPVTFQLWTLHWSHLYYYDYGRCKVSKHWR